MEKVGKAIVKLRIPILILSVLLLIPAGIGYVKTKVNYDILYYLPGDIDTMKGQDILMDEFNKGAYATVVVKGMDAKGIEKIEVDRKVKDYIKIEYAGGSNLYILATQLTRSRNMRGKTQENQNSINLEARSGQKPREKCVEPCVRSHRIW